MRVAVASGKGGTGKTLLATHLATQLAPRLPRVTYADADVEAPNGHLFLKPEVASVERFRVPVPRLAGGRCDGCGDCEAACAFNAIVALGSGVSVYPELCHSCGVCVRACGLGVLEESQREIGSVRRGRAGQAGFVEGLLDVGEARSAPLIEAVVEATPEDGVTIIDAPPGTSCAALAAVVRADLVILVCEPTPFGLHDLALSVEMCRRRGLSTAAVLNRSNLGNGSVREYLAREGVPLLVELPFDRRIAAACASGRLAAREAPLLAQGVERVARWILGQEARS